MSRDNKVNPGRYTSAGRLSPDDLSRERRGQACAGHHGRRGPREGEGDSGSAEDDAGSAAKTLVPGRRR